MSTKVNNFLNFEKVSEKFQNCMEILNICKKTKYFDFNKISRSVLKQNKSTDLILERGNTKLWIKQTFSHNSLAYITDGNCIYDIC